MCLCTHRWVCCIHCISLLSLRLQWWQIVVVTFSWLSECFKFQCITSIGTNLFHLFIYSVLLHKSYVVLSYVNRSYSYNNAGSCFYLVSAPTFMSFWKYVILSILFSITRKAPFVLNFRQFIQNPKKWIKINAYK